MKNTLILFAIFFTQICLGQTAKLYRSGTLISTYSTVREAFVASSMGDSILLSAHTFNEYDIGMPGGRVLQGTMTPTDTSMIDAKGLGRCGMNHIGGTTGKPLVIRDVIFTHGKADIGGGINISDHIILRGRTTIRNCHATKYGGAVYSAVLYDNARLTHNSSDSSGGAAVSLQLTDSSEVSYNTSPRGGAIGHYAYGGSIRIDSPGVKLIFNKAYEKGGAIFGTAIITAGQILYNEAPQGAAIYMAASGVMQVMNAYFYNPRPDGTRPIEIYSSNGTVKIDGSWFGKSDTVGMFLRYTGVGSIIGHYAKANWSVNRGKPLGKNDTLFPIGAAFTYSDGSAMPDNSCPWLVGKFSSSTGTMLTPNPAVSAKDTMHSLFRTYVYPSGGSGSKAVSFTCIVDGDTFRASPLVWGRDTSKLSIGKPANETQVLVYPNPATDIINVSGAEEGSVISLTDMAGRLVAEQEVRGSSSSISVNQLSKGAYLLTITTKEGSKGSTKILKE